MKNQNGILWNLDGVLTKYGNWLRFTVHSSDSWLSWEKQMRLLCWLLNMALCHSQHVIKKNKDKYHMKTQAPILNLGRHDSESVLHDPRVFFSCYFIYFNTLNWQFKSSNCFYGLKTVWNHSFLSGWVIFSPIIFHCVGHPASGKICGKSSSSRIQLGQAMKTQLTITHCHIYAYHKKTLFQCKRNWINDLNLDLWRFIFTVCSFITRFHFIVIFS